MNKLMIILFLSSTSLSLASIHYVDKNANGNNSGTSWANAWQSFSSINWSSIQPGDVVYISGGSDSTQYNEQLTVGKSGTAGNPITIIAGKYSPSPGGHSGRVIIDGGLSRIHSIYVQNKNYVTIKGFECRHATMGVEIEDYASNIILDSLNIYDFQGQAGIMLNGASTYTIDYTTIRNCRIVSYQLYNGQTDGIYAQRCQRTLLHNNYIHQRNQDPSAHTDCLQAYLTNGWVIYNNFFINDSVYSPEGGGTPMILGSEGTNPVIIYNNFLYMGGIWDPSGSQNSSLWTRWYNNNPMPPTWVIHNTIVVNGPRCRTFIQEYNAITINNILAVFSTSGGMANLEENLPTAIPVDSTRHNLFWRSFGDAGFTGQFTGNGHMGSVSGWTNWVSTYGGTGVHADPLFIRKIGYESNQGVLVPDLKSNSPAIGMGEDIGPYLYYFHNAYNIDLPLTDIYGNPRNLNHPSIGAYEFTSGSGTFQLSLNINDGHNLVSVPGINPNGMGVNEWWPHLTGSVFGFNGIQYIVATNATPGVGYWMKNVGTETYYYPAIEIIPHYPIPVHQNWNIIGVYENSIPTSELTTYPWGQITGIVWGWNGTNFVNMEGGMLEPGYGYWIKLLSACNIILPEPPLAKVSGDVVDYFKEDWGRIVLSDAAGTSFTLYAVKGKVDLDQYEMPPVPQAGMFDVRYSSGRVAENINSVAKTIVMQGIKYPLIIKAENIDIQLMDETGKTLNLNLSNGEEVTISDNTITKLKIVSGTILNPVEYSLDQNYPNPFNPTTTIEFSLPKDENKVTLSIYNLLGQKVAELVNKPLAAGRYSYQWNAKDSATGVYIYELKTDNFTSVKKMVLIR